MAAGRRVPLPPASALWHETNDNIGERPHVVFRGRVVGLVRRGTRLVVTPNDVVFSGRDGTPLHSWTGAQPGAGMGTGRGAGDIKGDHVNDIAVGSYPSDEGAPDLGFDAVGWATSTATARPTCSPRRPTATPST